jgi:hypothetical protein
MTYFKHNQHHHQVEEHSLDESLEFWKYTFLSCVVSIKYLLLPCLLHKERVALEA